MSTLQYAIGICLIAVGAADAAAVIYFTTKTYRHKALAALRNGR